MTALAAAGLKHRMLTFAETGHGFFDDTGHTLPTGRPPRTACQSASLSTAWARSPSGTAGEGVLSWQLFVTVMSLGEAVAAAQRLLEHLRRPFCGAAARPKLSASVGIAVRPAAADGLTGHEVLKRADAAMYHAKSVGGNRSELYESAMALCERDPSGDA